MSTQHLDTTLQEQADALFDGLSSALRHAPEDPGQALHTLRVADRAFDALHTWLRAGNPLPQPWAAARVGQEPHGEPGDSMIRRCHSHTGHAREDVLDTAVDA